MEIVVQNILLHYEVINPVSKKDCLVLHGWGQSGAHWLPIVQELSTEFRYIVLDLPGFGRSALMAHPAGVAEYANIVKDFIAKTKLRHPTIIGHSFGGQIATLLAARDRELWSQLLLVSPSAIRQRSAKEKAKVWIFHQFSFLKRLLPSAWLKRILRLVSTTDYYNASPRHQEILKRIVTEDLSPLLGTITIPVKLIWGDRDEAIPYRGKEMVDKLAHAELYVLYGAGHNPHVYNCQELVDVLNVCLRGR